MKSNRWYTAAGLLVFLLLCLVPNGQAQQGTPLSQVPGTPWQLGQSFVFSSTSGASGAFNAKGILYWKLVFVPDGTVSACSVSVDSSATGSSFSVGGLVSAGTIGSCASPGSYVTPAAVGPTNFGQLTPAITGTGHVTIVLLGYTENPALSSGAASNVAVTNFPATQPVSATSLPLPTSAATAANQVPPGTAGSPNASVQSIQGIASMTPVKTDGSGVTQPVSLATAPTTPTQPSGFGSGVTNQQAVTASAVALPSNAVHGVCVKALSANTIPVYVGFSGVTTSTGYQLNAGDSVCGQLSNTNLIFVIATTTGASVAFFGN
jgi:hypothetical protein